MAGRSLQFSHLLSNPALRLFAAATAGAALLAGCTPRQTADLPPPPFPSFDAPVVRVPPAATRPAVPPPIPSHSEARAGWSIPPEWAPRARPNSWRWIVIHHSATPSGSATSFDREHRSKGWDELGYHFVIGNGIGSRDGQVEVGSRWGKQKWGAHAKTADQQFNNFGIGICLVGNFDIDRPSPAQTQVLAKLVGHLMATYQVPADRVIGHGETKPTDCPGRNVSIAEVRRMAARMASDMALARPEIPRGELLHAAAR